MRTRSKIPWTAERKRVYHQRRYAAQRDLVIMAKSVPCKDCRRSFHYCAMDFDHVRGKKKFMVSQFYRMGIDATRREIAKCEVVCANCHRLRTHRRKKRSS